MQNFYKNHPVIPFFLLTGIEVFSSRCWEAECLVHTQECLPSTILEMSCTRNHLLLVLLCNVLVCHYLVCGHLFLKKILFQGTKMLFGLSNVFHCIWKRRTSGHKFDTFILCGGWWRNFMSSGGSCGSGSFGFLVFWFVAFLFSSWVEFDHPHPSWPVHLWGQNLKNFWDYKTNNI